MRYECERCGYERDYGAREVELLGGYRAEICNRCLNEWISRGYATSLNERFVENRAQFEFVTALAVAEKPTTLDHYREIEVELNAIRREAFDLAAEFCKPITKPE